MRDAEPVLVEKDYPLGWLIFNRPEKMNAFNVEMWEAIPPAVKALEDDPEVRAIVIRGADERAFAAGADISEFDRYRKDPKTAVRYDEINFGAFDAFAHCSKPTIAAICGFCIGGGLGVALNIDIRLAAEDATFAITPAKLGLGYPFAGVERVVQELGPAGARYLFLTGKQFSAQKALELGVVQEVFPKGEVVEAAAKLGRLIAGNAPIALRALKESIRQSVLARADRNMEHVEGLIRACFESEDYQEGVRSFMEKRRPVFQDR